MMITNERLASELMGLPAEQREFWAHVLLNGIPATAGHPGRSLIDARANRRAIARGMTLGEIAADPELVPLLETELLQLPGEVRQRLANLLLESVGTDTDYVREVEEEAHRRWLELESGR